MYSGGKKDTSPYMRLDQCRGYELMYKFLCDSLGSDFTLTYDQFDRMMDVLLIGMLSFSLKESRPLAFKDLLTLTSIYYDSNSSNNTGWSKNRSVRNFIKVSIKLRHRAKKILLKLGEEFWIKQSKDMQSKDK